MLSVRVVFIQVQIPRSVNAAKTYCKDDDAKNVNHEAVTPANYYQSRNPKCVCVDASFIDSVTELNLRCVDERVAISVPTNFSEKDDGPKEVDLDLDVGWVTTDFPHSE